MRQGEAERPACRQAAGPGLASCQAVSLSSWQAAWAHSGASLAISLVAGRSCGVRYGPLDITGQRGNRLNTCRGRASYHSCPSPFEAGNCYPGFACYRASPHSELVNHNASYHTRRPLPLPANCSAARTLRRETGRVRGGSVEVHRGPSGAPPSRTFDCGRGHDTARFQRLRSGGLDPIPWGLEPASCVSQRQATGFEEVRDAVCDVVPARLHRFSATISNHDSPS